MTAMTLTISNSNCITLNIMHLRVRSVAQDSLLEKKSNCKILFHLQNIIKSANTILNMEYEKEWQRIRKLTGHGAEHLLQKFDKYISVLAESQHDTYTSPFEIVTSDLGM